MDAIKEISERVKRIKKMADHIESINKKISNNTQQPCLSSPRTRFIEFVDFEELAELTDPIMKENE